jgi:hypothetical protein
LRTFRLGRSRSGVTPGTFLNAREADGLSARVDIPEL